MLRYVDIDLPSTMCSVERVSINDPSFKVRMHKYTKGVDPDVMSAD